MENTMSTEERKKWFRELCHVRSVTSDKDPWEASTISFLISEVMRRDALLYRIRLAIGNSPVKDMIKEELGEE